MTKDYASRSNKKKTNKKQSQKKRRQQTTQDNNLPGWVWLVIGLALGGLIALAYITFNNTSSEDSLTSQELNMESPLEAIEDTSTASREITETIPASQTVSVSDETDNNQDTQAKPDFAFYTLLPEQEVVVQNRRHTRPSNTKPKKQEKKKKQHPVRNGKYILQAGSFQGQADAQKLNQRIQSKGLASSIEEGTLKQNEKSVIWHRVIVGPFSGNAQIEDAENTLKALGITPLLLKRN